MSKLYSLETEFGMVVFEVEGDPEIGAKGGVAKGDEFVGSSRFDDAMVSLKAFASKMQKTISDLDVRPEEVTIELGATLKADTGLFVFKAGAQADMKITMKWSFDDESPARAG